MSTLLALLLVTAIPNGIEELEQRRSVDTEFNWPKPRFVVTRLSKPLHWAGCKLADKLRNGTGTIAFLAYGVDKSVFEQADFQEIHQFGPIISGTAAVETIIALSEYGIYEDALIDVPQGLRPALEAARTTIEVANTESDFTLPSTATRVILGIYDTGVDLTHPGFLDSDGQTKVIATWNQKNDEYCDATMIQEKACSLTDSLGHGTSVLGVATSNSKDNLGIAPGVSIAAVQDKKFEELLPALSFFAETAEQYGAPLVINLSLSGHEGPHDGASLESIAINSFPHLVVTAAGNEGDKSIHLSGTLVVREQAAVEFPIAVDLSEGVAEGIVEAWGSPSSELWLGFGIADSDGTLLTTSGTVSLGADGRTEKLTIPNSRDTLLTATLDAAARPHPITAKKQVRLTYRFTDLRLWTNRGYKLVLRLGGFGGVDVWLDAPSSTPVLPRFEHVPLRGTQHEIAVTKETTISDIATSSMAIAVGSLINRDEIEFGGQRFQRTLEGDIGTVSKFSSYGPSKAASRTGLKPDLVAPGEFVMTSRSRQATSGVQIAGDWTIMSGTSIASPMVAGVALMLLQFDPQLTREDLRERILENTSRAPHGTEPRFGRGVVNARRASYGLFDSSASSCGCRSGPLKEADIRPNFLYIGLFLGLLLLRRRV
ncbi:MAG: S8 family serine peptidase [Myxococcota bacterium]|nr:S8 family serine peptidase [Myxococcota bacterium]